MKKYVSFVVAVVMSAVLASAQVVTTTPEVLTASSTNITITFHADWGNAGMAGLASNAQVYAHTGVITNLSSSPSDWKYSPNWGDNSAKYKLKYAGTNLWTLTIPSIREYYGITDPSVKIEKLAFVFRTGDKSKEGKDINGNDIFLTIFPDNYPAPKEVAYPGGKPKMGAVANSDGSVTFCLAAPDKKAVSILGSWNNYTLNNSCQMNYCNQDGTRYFWTTIPGIADGRDRQYYYLIDGQTTVGDPYAHLVLDPWNDKYISSDVFPNMPYYPTHYINNTPLAIYNSNQDNYDWEVKDFKGVPQSDLLIYELLIRDFTGTEGASNGNGTVKGLIDKLDYIKGLGVNAIELMPIMEFNGNISWGYNTNFYMAPDKAYGTPNDYRKLIDECHKRGLAVILDIVFNQTDGLHPWFMMYPRVLSKFYNGSAPHAYSVLNDWNQDNPLVQQQFKDALAYWMTTYKVDGFRFDLVKGLGDNSSYGNVYNPSTNTWGTPSDANTNRYNATRVARMKELHNAMREVNPNAYFINENLATPEEENQMAADGEINWANINNSSCQFAMGYESEAGLNRFYAPQDSRTWGSTVSYAESHDEERMAYKQAQWGATGVKGNATMSMRRLGSVAAQMLMTPGAHMIWQFQEFGADETTKETSGGNNTSPKKVVWSYLDKAANASLCQSYRDLLSIRSEYAHMFRQDVTTTVSLNTWTTGRTLKLTSGAQTIVLVVNPQLSGNLTIPSTADLSGAKLLAASAGVTPTLNGNSVTLPAGAFAVYGSKDLTSVEKINVTDDINISVANGCIHVEGTSDFRVFNTMGIEVSPTIPSPGIYIVTLPAHTPVKVLVK